MVTLIHEIDASEAFRAREAVIQVMAVTAVIAILAPEERMAIVSIADLIAEFAFIKKSTVDAAC